MKNKIILEEDKLRELYINNNLTVAEVSKLLNVSTSTVARFLSLFNIKKDNSLRCLNIAKKINSRTEEERLNYSKAISTARVGKGVGKSPWNKGLHTGNGWSGRHHTDETKQKISKTKMSKTPEEKAEIEARRLKSRVYGDPWNKGISTGPWTDDQKSIALAKQHETKTKNKSFKSSSPEDLYYSKLCDEFGADDVVRQYFDAERYPFNCDFYIKSKDLFIELNLTWTHFDHRFTGSDDDLKVLAIWTKKAEKSDYYKNAIYTWTTLDVRKFAAAEKNNLNYIVYYTEEEAMNDFYRRICK